MTILPHKQSFDTLTSLLLNNNKLKYLISPHNNTFSILNYASLIESMALYT